MSMREVHRLDGSGLNEIQFKV